MKKFNYILICLVITSFVMVSCNGLLDADSERYTFDENYQMSSDHDSLYAMVGILSQLQKLGDRYVLLGELRGDLMQTNDEASLYLKQINEFNISKDNPYTSTKEYYSIINNCNYTIQYVDTAKVKNAEKPMLRVMAAAKAIRAWTYLQLVLNYGSAKYIDRPILTSTDAEMTYPVYNLSQLADALIEDLLPFKDVEPLQLGVFAEYNSNLSMLPIKFLLGDLYLWKGDYEHAANMYYELMYAKSLVIKKDYMNYWEYSDKFVKTILHIDWKGTFKAGSTEVLAALSSSPDYGSPFTLDSLSYYYKIGPSDLAISNWTTASYFINNDVSYEGDARGYDSYYNEYSSTFSSSTTTKLLANPIITKFIDMETETDKRIVIYRNSLLYLRYAEAINRLGYPQMAFAVLKYGLNSTTMSYGKSSATVPFGTIYQESGLAKNNLPSYLNFTDFRFANNIGIRARGLGNVKNDTIGYIIKKQNSMADSINYVEDKIVEELALEMAFEGNRFQDLVRIALRRNDPAYLAKRVSAKYTTNKAAMLTKLMDPSNWYLPK